MIHYHGSPITSGGMETVRALYGNGANLTSFACRYQLKHVAKLNCKVVLDNGAFSAWMKAKKTNEVVNWDAYWTKYYLWVQQWYHRIEWFLIPDVIEGTEAENDELVLKVPLFLRDKAVPVWHSVESIERLVKLCERFPIVAIGACGEHRHIMGDACQQRLKEAFDAIYVERNLPVKIHGLRMLDGRVVSRFPLDSGDSTKVAICVPKTEKYIPDLKGHLTRTAVFRAMIDRVKSPTVAEYVERRKKEIIWERKVVKLKNQMDLFA